jgi:hypothetical protein
MTFEVKGRGLVGKAFCLTSAALSFVGCIYVARAEAQAAPAGDAFDAYIDELRRDYPDIYAQRRALSAQAGSMTTEELGRQLSEVTAPALAKARALTPDDLAMRMIRLEVDEYRQALARAPDICWGMARGGAPQGAFDEATVDEELRIRTEQLRYAAKSPGPPGPRATPEEMKSISHVLTQAHRDDAMVVADILSTGGPPSDVEDAKAFCRWQMAFYTEVLNRGPEFAGRFVRSI